MTSVDQREGRPDLLYVRFDDSGDDVVFGLEVVLDVAGGYIRGLCDVRERGPFDALLVQKLGRGGDEPLSLPGPALDGRPRLR